MRIVMYFIWLFILYAVTKQSLIYGKKFRTELFTSSIAAFITSIGGIRPYYQIAMFISVYLFMSLATFIIDIIYAK